MAAYPRKQTLFIFMICALLVGGVAFYVYGQSPRGAASADDAAAITALSAREEISSSSDWQKQFLNGATSSALKAQTAAVVSTKKGNMTATEKLGEGFFTKYAELSKAGLTGDPSVAANVMGQVAAGITANLPSPEVYNTTDITPISDTDKASLASYQRQISAIFAAYMPREHEAIIAEEALTADDMTQLARLDPVIAGYSNIVSHLLKVPVPSPLAQMHLDLINGFSIALHSAESLRHVDTDPVRGLAVISLEVGGFQNIASAAAGIQAYLTAAGVAPTL